MADALRHLYFRVKDLEKANKYTGKVINNNYVRMMYYLKMNGDASFSTLMRFNTFRLVKMAIRTLEEANYIVNVGTEKKSMYHLTTDGDVFLKMYNKMLTSHKKNRIT